MTGEKHNDRRTRDRILQATTEWIADTGLLRVSINEIAQRSRLARATIYLHFPGRQALINAAVQSELDRFFDDVGSYIDQFDQPEERLVHGFAYAYRLLRAHRTLNAVLQLNPQILLPFVFGDAPAISRARRAVSTYLVPTALSESAKELAAEHIVRTYHSLILAPSEVFNLDVEDGPERYARSFLLPLIPFEDPSQQ